MSIKSQLEAITKKRMQDVSEIARVSIIRVGNRVITASPVDKGSFRNQWNTSINSISYDTSKPDSKGGADSINELASEISDLNLGATAYFTNPMPYGPRLEYDSYSEQAPNGMLRVNTDLWEMIVNQEVEKRK